MDKRQGLWRAMAVGVVMVAGCLVACPQPTEHIFDPQEIGIDQTLEVTAGGLVRLDWNMDWRDFEPRLVFKLAAVGDPRDLPCELEREYGVGANGSRWVGLRAARDCPNASLPMVMRVRTTESNEPLLEKPFTLNITGRKNVTGEIDAFSPPPKVIRTETEMSEDINEPSGGEPNSRARGWLLVNNFSYTDFLSLGAESTMRRGGNPRTCRQTPPSPPPLSGMIASMDPADLIFSNCLGGQTHALTQIAMHILPPAPEPTVDEEGEEVEAAPKPELPELPKPECTPSFGGQANEDERGYQPNSGHLELSYAFPSDSPVPARFGCRYQEYLKGPFPHPKKIKRTGKGKRKRSMPMVYDLRKYDRFTFMARSVDGNKTWATFSLSYWTDVHPKPQQSLELEYLVEEHWKRFEINLDTELWLDAAQLKEAVTVNIDVYKDKAACDGGAIKNPSSGTIEITNLYFRKRSSKK